MKKFKIYSLVLVFFCHPCFLTAQTRNAAIDFNSDWKFHLGEVTGGQEKSFNDQDWRKITLPHDWSIELPFDKESPTGTGGGALRGGIGWYRKSFVLPAADRGKKIFIDFDGVYRNSEVWINGHSVGKRPSGYISFRYELTPFLFQDNQPNLISVRVDNSQQPNSRWYSGSGIYRNVRLVAKEAVSIDHWGVQVNTPQVSPDKATVVITSSLRGTEAFGKKIIVKTQIRDAQSQILATQTSTWEPGGLAAPLKGVELSFAKPHLWSLESPYLYEAVTSLWSDGKMLDQNVTRFGARFFNFDPDKGFFLNGKYTKIRGVCDHADLGCLGSVVNRRGIQRQLEILKAMGCNAIRTSHNPPAPELLDLCDQMGFIVMDEAFDMWKWPKNKFDYHLDWDQWHAQDLTDQIIRDRNHPCVFIWSVGNEIPEQRGPFGDKVILERVTELVSIVKNLDPTRPTVTANDEVSKGNNLLASGQLDLIGYNYHHAQWMADSVFGLWGKKPFIVTESVSALETRGHYDMPADSIRRWPARWDLPLENANADLTCSSYDNVATPWGSTHEETLKVFEKYAHISGMFIWTGFDYLGEPTPYPWPARSSYFGIIDLAGFPKDIYYLYQSLWTSKPVLHLLPHWNWNPGQLVDVWAFYSQADETELYLNGKSQGIRTKTGDQLHVSWKVPFEPGILKLVSRKGGKLVKTTEIRTAGKPARIELSADRSVINASGKDISYVTVKILDKEGNLVPDAQNLVNFSISGEGQVLAVDNGSPTSLESFQDSKRKAFNGLCLAVVTSKGKKGTAILSAQSEGLTGQSLKILIQ